MGGGGHITDRSDVMMKFPEVTSAYVHRYVVCSSYTPDSEV